MNNEKDTRVIENRAESTGTAEKIACENCFEEYIFGMKDNFHEFSLGLSTVLECLKFAETEEIIPKLPEMWWVQVNNNYYKGNYYE